MTMAPILDTIRALAGVLELAPVEGSRAPEIAWGDHFFYYAPDGQVPERGQPYATVVTKDYPGDTLSDLDPEDRWRVNIHVGRDRLIELLGEDPRSATAPDFSAADTILPHPVYGAMGWIAVVNPGRRTTPTVVALLREAHEDARRRALRHAQRLPSGDPAGSDPNEH